MTFTTFPEKKNANRLSDSRDKKFCWGSSVVNIIPKKISETPSPKNLPAFEVNDEILASCDVIKLS